MWLSVSFPICNIIPVTLPAILFNVKRKSQEVLWRVYKLSLKHTQNLHANSIKLML